MFTITPLFGALPGGMEWAVILLIAVLLFGANKIPKLARSTGQAMGEFQRGREEIEDELQDMRGEETESTETDTASTTSEAETSSESTSDSKSTN
ncbi:Sec-independent protein translocase subunit TatA/TatB [Halobacterium zhouii]|uniref:Sec-independent protein translocase subunit TatA/TatB n=1 Tax=Halobacterium zhouii TaxID=2902624 RepID=UPI001E48F6BC|nr:twin-arginine translocase TatA/TatE family subunit [Halobacterium zhouii]